MSTLADRLLEALNARPGASQAELARYCKARGPSVSDWFRGETKSLKAQSLVLAAEYLDVRARWLLDGVGPMRHDHVTSGLHVMEPQPPSVATALPISLAAITRLTPGQWRMVRARLDDLPEQPDNLPGVLADVGPMLGAAPQPKPTGTSKEPPLPDLGRHRSPAGARAFNPHPLPDPARTPDKRSRSES